MSSTARNIPFISGFSRLDRNQRIEILANILERDDDLAAWLDGWIHSGAEEQAVFETFSENYITNYPLPLGVVPNMMIDGQNYMVPMVIEESSVVAAAARSAKFWADNGGFRTEVAGTVRKGQIHFTWSGSAQWLHDHFGELRSGMMAATEQTTRKMRMRGGGIRQVVLIDKTGSIPGYFQVDVSFETADAMGANFINTCLEEMAQVLSLELARIPEQGTAEVIMAILSNYTPDSVVRCSVECDTGRLARISGQLDPPAFARKFELANRIAVTDVSRAVTHNKGIYNGVDAVLLATGNDWRAAEACGHAFASSPGSYRALTDTDISDGRFRYTLTLPLAPGTVGGLTGTHPVARFALNLLGNPGSAALMRIAAAAGLANNFSAVTALITSGIQQGHMKMHLPNILKQLNAGPGEEAAVRRHFEGKPVSYAAVELFINQLRNQNAGDTR